MSTYWYYECLSHDPPLRSDGEFTQHTSDEHYQRGLELMASRPTEEPNWGAYWASNHDSALYFTAQALTFLKDHPTCHLGIVNEYGDHATPLARRASRSKDTA